MTLTEETPIRPVVKKGKFRAQIAALLMDEVKRRIFKSSPSPVLLIFTVLTLKEPAYSTSGIFQLLLKGKNATALWKRRI